MRCAMVLIATLLLLGCSDENAAKIAPYLGFGTLNEKKADTYAKEALRVASRCDSLDVNDAQLMECVQKSIEFAQTADSLYRNDCAYGNSRACRKQREFYVKWDTRQTE